LKRLLSAVFLGLCMLDGFAAPTLAETEQFIAQNMQGSDSFDIKVSCASIEYGTHFVSNGVDAGWGKVMFAPREVRYSEPATAVRVDCLTGLCVRALDSRNRIEALHSNVDSARLLSALQYHQRLCGGTIRTPF
jgi:hypothetical protein